MLRRSALTSASFVALTLATLTTLRVEAAHAQRGDAPNAGALPIVELTVRGTPELTDWLRASITPSDFEGVELRFQRRDRWDLAELVNGPPPPGVRVIAWIDLSELPRAGLYFADPERERFLIRELSLPDGLSPVGSETIAQVLEMSIEALLEDEDVGVSRAEAVRALPVTTSPEAAVREGREEGRAAEPTRALALAAGPFYAARLVSDEVPLVHGPGIALGFRAGGPETEWAFGLATQYELPVSFIGETVGLSWSTLGARATVERARRFAAGRITLGGRLGVGLDFVRFEPRAGSSGEMVELTSPRTSHLLVFGGALVVCTGPDQVGVCGALFTDAYPTRVHYELGRDDGVTRVFVPWRVRPGLSLAVVLR